jgi:uncharacterized membrane protein (UPF0127 family)
MATALPSSTKGAAICVALFIFPPLFVAAWPFVNALIDVAPPAYAKMRQDTLKILSSGGAEHSFAIEVASSEKEKALGLMFRTELSDTQGMLFPYTVERSLQMWMHNTYIPLDMLFIRADGIITHIEEQAEPLSDRVISSGAPVLAVLEIPGGAAARLGIKAGDKVRYPIFSGS